MSFGYFPDYQGKNALKDLYLRLLGFPYAPRRNEARLVFKLLSPKVGDKILDLGCGDGIWTNELSKRKFDITGLDISKTNILKAKTRAQKMGLKTKFITGNAQKMPLPNSQFTSIFSISTFEHIRNNQAAFKECYRILKPKGAFVLSVPSTEIPSLIKLALRLPLNLKKALFNDLIQKSKNPNEYCQFRDQKFHHFQTYTLKALKNQAKNMGFSIEKTLYNVGLFGQIPHSLIHTLKIFHWKSNKTGYIFKNEFIFALFFPVFYPFYRLDDFLSSKKGTTIILKLRKI